MVRGLYTGASAMAAKERQMAVVANNLANVNTDGYKKDLTLFKAYPEMLIRRMNDDGVLTFPLGGGTASMDTRPVVGRLGTGVAVNEVFTQLEQGSLKQTENQFDLALEGEGFFTVLTPKGERYTRRGSFSVDANHNLVTKEGHVVLGEKGPLRVKSNNFSVNQLGMVFYNPIYASPNQREVQSDEAAAETVFLDRLKLVRFERPRYLEKEGASLFSRTEEAGEVVPADLLQWRGNREIGELKVSQGFLETSNVQVVSEMVRMIEVQRAYEASQKSISASDQLLERLINQMGRIA